MKYLAIGTLWNILWHILSAWLIMCKEWIVGPPSKSLLSSSQIINFPVPTLDKKESINKYNQEIHNREHKSKLQSPKVYEACLLYKSRLQVCCHWANSSSCVFDINHSWWLISEFFFQKEASRLDARGGFTFSCSSSGSWSSWQAVGGFLQNNLFGFCS